MVGAFLRMHTPKIRCDTFAKTHLNSVGLGEHLYGRATRIHPQVRLVAPSCLRDTRNYRHKTLPSLHEFETTQLRTEIDQDTLGRLSWRIKRLFTLRGTLTSLSIYINISGKSKIFEASKAALSRKLRAIFPFHDK